MYGFYLLLCKYNLHICHHMWGPSITCIFIIKKANIFNWAKPRPHSLGACTSCNSDPYKMYVWEVWQQQCLEGDSIACFKKHLNGLLPGYQRKKKNDKPIFWHFSLDHFFFQIHKAHFSPLEEYNKTKNSINGFYLASPLDDKIMNYKVLIMMLTWSWKMFHLDHDYAISL